MKKDELIEKLELLQGVVVDCKKAILSIESELNAMNSYYFADQKEKALEDGDFTVKRFINACCDVDKKHKSTAKSIFDAYEEYISPKAFRFSLSKRRFNEELRNQGYLLFNGTANKLYVRGIKLK